MNVLCTQRRQFSVGQYQNDEQERPRKPSYAQEFIKTRKSDMEIKF